MAPFAMADEDPCCTRSNKHVSGDFAGEGAFFAPVQVLTPDANVGSADCGDKGQGTEKSDKN